MIYCPSHRSILFQLGPQRAETGQPDTRVVMIQFGSKNRAKELKNHDWLYYFLIELGFAIRKQKTSPGARNTDTTALKSLATAYGLSEVFQRSPLIATS